MTNDNVVPSWPRASGTLPLGFLSNSYDDPLPRIKDNIEKLSHTIAALPDASGPHIISLDLKDITGAMEQILAHENVFKRHLAYNNPAFVQEIQKLVRTEICWSFEREGQRLPIDQRVQILEKASEDIRTIKWHAEGIKYLYRDQWDIAFCEIYLNRLNILDDVLLEIKNWHLEFQQDVARGLFVRNREDIFDIAMKGYFGL